MNKDSLERRKIHTDGAFHLASLAAKGLGRDDGSGPVLLQR